MRPWAWLRGKFDGSAPRAAPDIAAAARAHIVEGLGRLAVPDGRPPPAGHDLPTQILAALLSKRFRKYGVSAAQKAAFRESIRLALEKDAPLPVCVSFGGYKLWRLAEAPEPDWAELFMLMYYARWLQPVAALYPPGVALTFASDDVVMARLSNLQPAEIESYISGFGALLAFVGRYLPGNLALSLLRIGSLYTPAEYEADLAARIQERMDFNRGKLPVLPPGAKERIELNVRLAPGQADDPQWRERVHAVHYSYYNILKRKAYLEAPERLHVAPHKFLGAPCIPVGTTKDSIQKFWIGAGALRRVPGGFVETVLSPSQLARETFAWAPMAIDGLRGRNFRRLRIIG
ncbi:MAG: hypothetical protein KIT16_14890 [Rhodospirillaceae bacterium]|nr:hypothetical protein [Rhodospirillaceae bacterium]